MISLIQIGQPVLATVILTLAVTADGQRSLRELAREIALNDPNGIIRLPQSPEHHEAKSPEELSRDSVVVVTGRLVHKGSYLSPKENYVLTDYDVADVNVLNGTLPVRGATVPGPTPSLVVSVWGGEVVVHGVQIRAEDQNFHPIREGVPYLLFLTPARSPESQGYWIYGAAIFEIESQKVKPLLKRGNQVFAWAEDVMLPELVARIQSAAKER